VAVVYTQTVLTELSQSTTMNHATMSTTKPSSRKRRTTPFQSRKRSSEEKGCQSQTRLDDSHNVDAEEQVMCYDCRRELDIDLYQPTEVWIWSSQNQTYKVEKVCPGGDCERFAATDLDGW